MGRGRSRRGGRGRGDRGHHAGTAQRQTVRRRIISGIRTTHRPPAHRAGTRAGHAPRRRHVDPTTGDADCVAIPDSVTGVGADVTSTYGVFTPDVDTANYVAERLVAFPTTARAAQAMSDFRTWLTQCHAATFHMDTFGPDAVSDSLLSIVPFGPRGDEAVADNQVIDWSESEHQYLALIV